MNEKELLKLLDFERWRNAVPVPGGGACVGSRRLSLPDLRRLCAREREAPLRSKEGESRSSSRTKTGASNGSAQGCGAPSRGCSAAQSANTASYSRSSGRESGGSPSIRKGLSSGFSSRAPISSSASGARPGRPC